jgi:hypothetical protein
MIAMVRGSVGDPSCRIQWGRLAPCTPTCSPTLRKWLYTHTNDADFRISVLNRHYVMHGFEPGNFYRPQDVDRMILAFDVLIDWQSHVNGNTVASSSRKTIRWSPSGWTTTMLFRRAIRR